MTGNISSYVLVLREKNSQQNLQFLSLKYIYFIGGHYSSGQVPQAGWVIIKSGVVTERRRVVAPARPSPPVPRPCSKDVVRRCITTRTQVVDTVLRCACAPCRRKGCERTGMKINAKRKFEVLLPIHISVNLLKIFHMRLCDIDLIYIVIAPFSLLYPKQTTLQCHNKTSKMTREDYRFCNLPMFIARTHKSNLLKENKIFKM